MYKKYFSGKNNDSLCDFVICQAKIELREAFEAADKNGDGILSADEYHDIFQSHGLAIGKRITFNAPPQYHEIKTCICMNPAIISLDCKALIQETYTSSIFRVIIIFCVPPQNVILKGRSATLNKSHSFR